MRRIGTFTDERLARRFADYLLTQSVDHSLDHDAEQDEWSLWVRDEQSVTWARDEYEQFLESPKAERFQVADQIRELREERIAQHRERAQQQREAARQRPAEQTMLDRPGLGSLPPSAVKRTTIPITIAIIAISVAVSFTSNFGRSRNEAGDLRLDQKTYFALSFVDRREYATEGDPFASLGQGEWWRLITPMFLHGDEFHLAFNMLWVFFLGSTIERLHGSWFFLILAMTCQIAGMLLQVSIPDAEFIPEPLRGSPFAIGASGAVYGLFGYLWIRPIVDRQFPVHLVPVNVTLMLGWLVLCMTPLVPDVANGAHVGGLTGGIAFALIGSVMRR